MKFNDALMGLNQFITDGSEYPKMPVFGYLLVSVLVGYISRRRARRNFVARYLIICLCVVLILSVLFSTLFYVDIIDLPRALLPWISVAFFIAGVGLLINILIPNHAAKSEYKNKWRYYLLNMVVIFGLMIALAPIYNAHFGWGFHGHWMVESAFHLH